MPGVVMASMTVMVLVCRMVSLSRVCAMGFMTLMASM